MEQNAKILYDAPREINIGDVFYKLKNVDFQVFREPCLVCKDKKELTVNGVTFRCPCCGDTKEVLRVNQYVVHRYRVFSISDEVNHSEWKPGEIHCVKFGIYRKAGLGYQWASYSEETISSDNLSRWLNPSEKEVLESSDAARFIFDDYQLAVRMAKVLTDKMLRELCSYNELHGTDHVATFKEVNDKKSR